MTGGAALAILLALLAGLGIWMIWRGWTNDR